MQDGVEQELKLTPNDEALLDTLANIDRLGSLRRVGTRLERQHNSFFDTSSGALRRARLGFRRRTIEGEHLARWSLKGDAALATRRGVASRAEIEVRLDADTPPVLALGMLRQAAAQRGAAALAETVGDALASGELPARTPYLETRTERQIVDLADDAHGWRVELALDRVTLLGHTYREIEIEAELQAGDAAALDQARDAIEALGDVRDSEGSKLGRAQAHLRACACGQLSSA